MTLELRKKLAAESWEEKIRKVGMLNDLVKRAPKLRKRPVKSLKANPAFART